MKFRKTHKALHYSTAIDRWHSFYPFRRSMVVNIVTLQVRNETWEHVSFEATQHLTPGTVECRHLIALWDTASSPGAWPSFLRRFGTAASWCWREAGKGLLLLPVSNSTCFTLRPAPRLTSNSVIRAEIECNFHSGETNFCRQRQRLTGDLREPGSDGPEAWGRTGDDSEDR